MANAVDDDDVTDPDENVIDVVNISGEIMKFELNGNKYKLKPKQTVKIHKAYALPKKLTKESDPIPSSIELLTNKKVLAITDPRVRPHLPPGHPYKNEVPAK